MVSSVYVILLIALGTECSNAGAEIVGELMPNDKSGDIRGTGLDHYAEAPVLSEPEREEVYNATEEERYTYIRRHAVNLTDTGSESSDNDDNEDNDDGNHTYTHIHIYIYSDILFEIFHNYNKDFAKQRYNTVYKIPCL